MADDRPPVPSPAGLDDEIDFLPVTQTGVNSIYNRSYGFLRRIRSTLESLSREVPSEALSPGDAEAIANYTSIFQSVLGCDFGHLFSRVASAKQILATWTFANVSASVGSIGRALLCALGDLSHLEYFLTVRVHEADREDSSIAEVSSPPQPVDVSQLLFLCRLCEQYVPLAMIDQHSISCQQAYDAGAVMITIEGRIQNLQDAITRSLLGYPWPGDEDSAVACRLPLMQLVLILDKIRGVDSEAPSAWRQLSVMVRALDRVMVISPDPNSGEMVARASGLAHEKLDECQKLSEATSAQMRTTAAPPGVRSRHVTTLADFAFLKRISSGAHARVFLAKKNITGDIYAIKVTPRSAIKQKNALKRILAERNILLEFNNPFIVNFCMFSECSVARPDFLRTLTNRLFVPRRPKYVPRDGVSPRR
jgi:hypothetical protein